MKFQIITFSFLIFSLGTSLAQSNSHACSEDEFYQKLDFWVGEWKVYDTSGKLVGNNKIEKILNGCAVMEHWTSVGGSEGKSLFYVDNNTRNWKQVWVTQGAKTVGGQKEKTMIKAFVNGGLRFQGELLAGDKTFLDRTTLTPNHDGSVRQLIEISRDAGKTWSKSFEGIYRKE
ncbi:hypothetical protein QQ008_25840 [Fulvivirgaceae bacterium BMA10]|uniref:DUF1579 domain-containing protein n=1 Tax=Splendidivirga corallicola TaxID=3051826 RepID=A0ABT8KXE4_9BACT|nr:hypothetical protein [Fulvivirgaceae bacterium BMA10]